MIDLGFGAPRERRAAALKLAKGTAGSSRRARPEAAHSSMAEQGGNPPSGHGAHPPRDENAKRKRPPRQPQAGAPDAPVRDVMGDVTVHEIMGDATALPTPAPQSATALDPASMTEGAGSAGPAAADAAPPPAAAPAASMETEPVPAPPRQPGAPAPAPVEEPPTSTAPGAEEPETHKEFVVEELVSFKRERELQEECRRKLSDSLLLGLRGTALSETVSEAYKEKFEFKVEDIFEKIVGDKSGLDQRVMLQGAFVLRKVQSELPAVLTARRAIFGAAG